MKRYILIRWDDDDLDYPRQNLGSELAAQLRAEGAKGDIVYTFTYNEIQDLERIFERD